MNQASNSQTAFTTSPFRLAKNIVVEIEKEWETVWEVFSELSAKPGGTCNESTIYPLHHPSLHIISTTQINTTKPSSS